MMESASRTAVGPTWMPSLAVICGFASIPAIACPASQTRMDMPPTGSPQCDLSITTPSLFRTISVRSLWLGNAGAFGSIFTSTPNLKLCVEDG